MGEYLTAMAATWVILGCTIVFAARQVSANNWNVNVGSNINTAPSVVNDPLLDFGTLYVNDYAQHRVVECFYNGTCKDFVQKGSGGLKWPWGIDFGHHDDLRGQSTQWDDRDKLYVASEGTSRCASTVACQLMCGRRQHYSVRRCQRYAEEVTIL